ncbi:pilus assembly protein Flp/PilA [Mycoplana sp. BE70]|uniref:Flp family type IVb pilin n=1 Tax=Mycoplana sp. BE70 TaxID=2817775 RepID=UPI0028649AFB|nr:Flp family type IVb pilin [Mycoplana sp. BE70]MDR6759669.1 pilus assembly protein Flp/PilA [Mycoplana sp. BE70]
MRIITSLMLDRSGATAIEYGLIAALVSIGLIGGLMALSDSLTNVFMTVEGHVRGAG